MISKRDLIVGSAALAVASALPSAAEAATYVVLGSRTVNLGSDHDRLRVGLLKGLFTHVRLEVTGNSIFMQDLKVTFVNGDVVDVPVRLLILEGSRTRDINLPGIARAIRYIDMQYVRVPLGGRATVTIVGRKL